MYITVKYNATLPLIEWCCKHRYVLAKLSAGTEASSSQPLCLREASSFLFGRGVVEVIFEMNLHHCRYREKLSFL